MAVAEVVKRASFAIEDMKEGGGNLWGSNAPVRAVVTGGRFTKEAPDGYNAEGNPIFGIALFRLNIPKSADQTDEEYAQMVNVNQSYSLGAQAGDNYTISNDGDFLIPNTDDSQIVKDSKFGLFTTSLQNEGVNKAVLQSFAWSDLVGLDGEFKRVTDKARDFGDQPGRNQKKSKFPPSTLLLVKLHGQPGSKPAAAPTTTTGNAKTTTAAAPAIEMTGDLDADTLAVLTEVLKAKGTVQKGRLTLAVSQAAGGNNPNRAAIAKRASDEGYLQGLAELGIIKFDVNEKGQPVSLVA